MKKIFVILVISVICINCNKRSNNDNYKTEHVFDDNNNLTNLIFQYGNSKNDYINIEYYKDGTPSRIAKIKNNKIVDVFISNNRSRQYISIGIVDNYHNLELRKTYSTNGNFISDYLYQDDSLYIFKQFGFMGQDSLRCFGVHNSKKEREGYYFVNDSLEIIESNQHKYFQVEASDVAIAGYNYSIKIKVLNEGGDNVNGKLFYKSDTIDFKNKTAELIIHPKQKGYKIITGKIEVIEDTLINDVKRFKDYEYTFYHNFEVVDFYDYPLPFFEERNNYLYDFDTIPLVSKVLEWI